MDSSLVQEKSQSSTVVTERLNYLAELQYMTLASHERGEVLDGDG